ncbi:hypothetical protein BCR35DRAFT_305797 [Leucosporidium creatinivorum]|uniref:Uncharacterized protein n=1 Tax=Leucosporidium creatinivorum TaxID=106004 RepID=A0A1Y2EYA6_9BASI|nr:hypothetical protein BCR35DRAFT_305797 [Leucosporidium creatinivorum]
MSTGTSNSRIAGAGAGNNGLQTMPPDLFVIVRPPPSKQTHPLNLQIQLINPNATRSATTASSSSRTSGEYSRTTTPMDSPSSIGANSFDAVAGASVGGGGLQRTPSVKSNRSGRSQTSSAGSAFSGNGGRRVQPLYNLDFHALLPTVVTDAGTDQKVAKFLKRGVEILGLAILDPIDLATPPTTPALSPSTSASSHPTPPSPIAESTPSSFLNRFKRLSFKSPSFTPPKAALALSPSTSLSEGLSTTTPSGLTVLPLIRTPSNTDAPRVPVGAAGDKVRGYAFTVRKWTRRDLEGTKEGAEAAGQIRFEWRRGKKKKAPRRGGGGEGEGGGRPKLERYASGSSAGEGRPASPVKTRSRSRGPSPGGGLRRQDTLEGEDLTSDPNNLCAPNGRRRSLTVTGPGGIGLGVGLEGRGSRPTSMHSDMEHERTDGEDEEDGDESDPEDSERPWTCHLVQSVSGFSSSASTPSPPLSSNTTNGSSSPPSPPIKRIHLGTLIPAPHHPKLVATLSVPFSLAPLALGTPKAGGMWGASEGLSVEEMKDCLSVSCLWVVVREGLGGLGAGGVSKGAKWKLGR